MAWPCTGLNVTLFYSYMGNYAAGKWTLKDRWGQVGSELTLVAEDPRHLHQPQVRPGARRIRVNKSHLPVGPTGPESQVPGTYMWGSPHPYHSGDPFVGFGCLLPKSRAQLITAVDPRGG